MTDGKTERIVYFDNAATSWPKPDEVLAAMIDWQKNVGGSPGRSGHRLSIASSRILEDTRAAIAELFNFPDPLRVAFAKNITEALNLAFFSLLRPGSHVVVPGCEHNSVMRPLRHLVKTIGLRLSLARTDPLGGWNPDDILEEVRGDTALVAVGHASNVTGRISPVFALARELRRRNIPLLVDGAQAAGALPIDLSDADNVVYAFTGHKSLLGPTGTGGVLMGESVSLSPLIYGGTGSRSDLDVQPEGYPDSLESGTMNILGVAGLRGALSHLNATGIDVIRDHERRLADRFTAGALDKVRGFVLYGGETAAERVPTLSFTLTNLNPSQLGLLLDRKYGILCRIGLHCNPNCHKAIGTFPEGTTRFSLSPATTVEEIDYAVAALAELAELS